MKKLFLILPLALIVCFMVGCQDKGAMAELEKFKAQAEVEEQNKALVRKMIEELNKGNVGILEEVLAPDYVYYTPSGSTKPMSKEETIESVNAHGKAFPDLNWNIEELIAEGDKVVLRFIALGTHQGEFESIPATGNKIEISAIEVFRIENGKIVEERLDGDMLGVMMQLGMELKPKEEK
jgi:steroid delta-isomerase-like uncharacterized protein